MLKIRCAPALVSSISRCNVIRPAATCVSSNGNSFRATGSVVADPGSLGIVLGGSGNGEQMSANKVKGIRAILACNNELARLGREHNNANVIALGGRMQSLEESYDIVKAFVTTEFSGEERHQRRIDLITEYENR